MGRSRSIASISLVAAASLLLGAALREGPEVAAFVAIAALFSPVSLFGGMVVCGAGLSEARRTGMSLTALGPLLGRYVTHEIGVRDDPGAKAITESILPPWSLNALCSPSMLALRWSGVTPAQTSRLVGYPPDPSRTSLLASLTSCMGARTHFIDSALDRFLPAMDQLVVLGAGFDTKIYRSMDKHSRLQVFEVDTPKTQPIKRKMLAASSLNTSAVMFVEVDFNVDNWLLKLMESGFDPSKRTFFIWEGVTMYLPTAIIDKTFAEIATCGKGSAVALDYISRKLVNDPVFAFVRWIFAWIREPLLFGEDLTDPARDHASSWVSRSGLSLEEHTFVIPNLYAMLSATVA